MNLRSLFEILGIVLAGVCVIYSFTVGFALQTCIIVTVIFLVYKYLLREILCPTGLRSKGIMQYAERGDIEGLKRELAKYNMNISIRDANNCTFLHWAAISGQVEMAEYLLKCGIDINATNKFGCTALHVTTGKDRLDIARLLIEYGANKDIRNSENQTAVELASSTPMKILLQIPLFQSQYSSYSHVNHV